MRRQVTVSLAMAAAAVVAAVGLVAPLVGCGSESSGGATVATTQDTTGAPPPTGSTATEPQVVTGATAPQRPPTPAITRIVVRDGMPEGGVARLEYERGERVRFTVQSDVADEVHVHGFDIRKDVPANGSVSFGFPADIEGVFEIELEGARIEIAELRVRP